MLIDRMNGFLTNDSDALLNPWAIGKKGGQRSVKVRVVFQICTSTVKYAMLTLSFERRL
jgi:hypothetical protein